MMENNIKYEELDFEKYLIENQENGIRLDKFLASKNDNNSRNYIQDLIKEGYVLVNNKFEKSSYKLRENDEVLLYYKEVEDIKILPQNIPLDIIYQDSNFAIINKVQGMVVHPSISHYNDTLVNALMYHIKDLSGINGVYRPGIIHRLDKDTSGLICIAKNDSSHNFLANQLKDHTMHRDYICIVKGILESKKGRIETLIGRDLKNRLKMAVVNENGKNAITEFEVLETLSDKYSLVLCHLLTGRTHQIRVHMNFIKHPIINDPLYGENNKINYNCSQLLHALKLTLISPTTNKEETFEAKIPEYFSKAIDYIKNGGK